MSDRLLMDKINSLPQPLFVRFCGDDQRWPVYDIDVQTGLMRIDVVGKIQVKHFGEVMDLFDADLTRHDPDDFYNEDTPQ